MTTRCGLQWALGTSEVIGKNYCPTHCLLQPMAAAAGPMLGRAQIPVEMHLKVSVVHTLSLGDPETCK